MSLSVEKCPLAVILCNYTGSVQTVSDYGIYSWIALFESKNSSYRNDTTYYTCGSLSSKTYGNESSSSMNSYADGLVTLHSLTSGGLKNYFFNGTYYTCIIVYGEIPVV